MSGFQDLFSAQAACYARARPRYPAELFAWLAGLAARRRLAWDAGTGNGQAAVGLAEHFEGVIATDGSEAQLTHAVRHERIDYRVGRAEASGIAPACVDLVAVAQALHWFDLDAFYAEVRRVARPEGVFAAWCYSQHEIAPAIDAISERFYHEIVGPYWPAGRRFLDERYETIRIPFDELREIPAFSCREEWTLGQYEDYLTSWSAVQRFREQRGQDPLEQIAEELRTAWGEAGGSRRVVWPIHLRVGRVRP